MGRRWQKWELEVLTKGYEAKESVLAIAEKLMRPQNLVYGKARSLGLSRNGRRAIGTNHEKWTEEDETILSEMYLDFRSDVEIARRLNRTVSAVRLRTNRLKLKRDPDVMRNLSWAPEDAVAILREKGVEAFKERIAEIRAGWEEERRTRVARAREARHQRVADLLKLHNADQMDRNLAILFKRAAGSTLEEVGADYDITRERVRQICEAMVKRQPADDEETE